MFSTKEPIFKVFDEIEADDHVGRIQFYEQHTEFIFALEERKQHFFSFHYIQSLFELGKYEHVLAEIDPLIEYVFLQEVNYNGKYTFEDLLFKKAQTLFQLVKYDEAIAIGEQLIGIHSENKEFQHFLQKAYQSQLNFSSAGIRLIALILIFFSAIFSAIIWLITGTYKQSSLLLAFSIMVSPCVLALALLGAAHLRNYIKSVNMTKAFVEKKASIKTGS